MTVSDCSKTIARIWVQCRLLKCMPWHVHRKFSGCRLIECKFIKNKQACRFLERKSWSFFTWVFFKVMDVSLKNDQLLFWNTYFDEPLEGHGHERKNYYNTIFFLIPVSHCKVMDVSLKLCSTISLFFIKISQLPFTECWISLFLKGLCLLAPVKVKVTVTV